MSDAAPRRTRSTPLVLGCAGGLLLLLLCGGLLGYLVLQGGRAVQVVAEQARQEEELASRWQAPAADAPPQAFVPDGVAGYALTTSDDNAAFPALGIEYDGTHAAYEKDGTTIDVAVYRMDDAQAAGVFDEVIRRIDDGERFASTSHVRTNRSLRFAIAPPDLHGRLWHAGGWVVFVRSATVADLGPFLKAYVEAIGDGS